MSKLFKSLAVIAMSLVATLGLVAPANAAAMVCTESSSRRATVAFYGAEASTYTRVTGLYHYAGTSDTVTVSFPGRSFFLRRGQSVNTGNLDYSKSTPARVTLPSGYWCQHPVTNLIDG